MFPFPDAFVPPADAFVPHWGTNLLLAGSDLQRQNQITQQILTQYLQRRLFPHNHAPIPNTLPNITDKELDDELESRSSEHISHFGYNRGTRSESTGETSGSYLDVFATKSSLVCTFEGTLSFLLACLSSNQLISLSSSFHVHILNPVLGNLGLINADKGLQARNSCIRMSCMAIRFDQLIRVQYNTIPILDLAKLKFLYYFEEKLNASPNLGLDKTALDDVCTHITISKSRQGWAYWLIGKYEPHHQ